MNSQGARTKLGQLLVERNWITGEQLIRAIQSQRLVGGRLGTCLLEMDILTEERLLDALSDQLAVPSIRIEQLRGISRAVLELIPRKLAQRCLAVPFSASDLEIHIATLNVDNLVFLDEIAFCTNRRVHPHIAHEVRVYEALEKYYELEFPQRYGLLLDRLNRAKYLWDESAKILLGAGENEVRMVWRQPEETFATGKILHAPAALKPQPSAGSTMVVVRQLPQGPGGVQQPSRPASGNGKANGSALTAPLPAAPPPAAPPPAAPLLAAPLPEALPEIEAEVVEGPLSLADVDRALAHNLSYQSVGEVMLRFLAPAFARVLLFQVQQGQAVGWLGHGSRLDLKLLAQLRLDLQQPSIFSSLIQGTEVYFGPLAPMPTHRQLARVWGGDLPQRCALIPVRVRERMVCAVYVDQAESLLEPAALDSLKRLAQKAAVAFEVCILRKKIQQI